MRKILFFLLLISNYGLNAQDNIYVDFDNDQVIDSIYLEYKGDKTARLVAKLSTNSFRASTTPFLTTEGYFNIYLQDDEIALYNNKDHVSRLSVTLAYDSSQRDFILTSICRYQDRDNDVNGGGQSCLDVATKMYTGEWSYSDIFDDIEGEYRIDMPKINLPMEISALPLAQINNDVFNNYELRCRKIYTNQLDSIFPQGNNIRYGMLLLDLENDYSLDTIFFNGSELQTTIYLENGQGIEIKSVALNFDSENYTFQKTSSGHILKSLVDEQAVFFKFNMEERRFDIQKVLERTHTVLIGSIGKTVQGIINFNHAKQEGVFINLKTGQRIKLSGSIHDGQMDLKEHKEKNEISGYFEGELQESFYFGAWISPNRKVEVPVIFEVSSDLLQEITFRNKALGDLIYNIEKSINKHDWDTFYSYCNSSIKEDTQLPPNKFIYTALGIKNKNQPTSSIEEINHTIKYLDDATIEKVVLDDVFGFLKFSGTILLKDGLNLDFSFHLTKDFEIIF